MKVLGLEKSQTDSISISVGLVIKCDKTKQIKMAKTPTEQDFYQWGGGRRHKKKKRKKGRQPIVNEDTFKRIQNWKQSTEVNKLLPSKAVNPFLARFIKLHCDSLNYNFCSWTKSSFEPAYVKRVLIGRRFRRTYRSVQSCQTHRMHRCSPTEYTELEKASSKTNKPKKKKKKKILPRCVACPFALQNSVAAQCVSRGSAHLYFPSRLYHSECSCSGRSWQRWN